MHVHLSEKLPDREWVWRQWPGTGEMGQTGEQFVKKMDTCKPKMDKALIFGLKSLASETPDAMRKDNDYILSMIEAFPDRFVGAGVIDPSWGKEAVKELQRFIDAGLRVVKMRFTSMHYHANCKASKTIFQEIENHGVLPVVHSDWTHFSNPLIIGDLAMMFPKVKIVMQHFGEYLSHDALSVTKKAENIYVDTSALVHPKNVIRFINEVSPDRIMFASDTVGLRGGLQPQDALNRIQCLGLSSELEEKVLGENAATLLESVEVKL